MLLVSRLLHYQTRLLDQKYIKNLHPLRSLSTHTNPGSQTAAATKLLASSASLRTDFDRDGFVLLPELFSLQTVTDLRDRYDDLFAGRFPTGVFPDEWHWREGLSLPNVPREIVNGWKSDPVVKQVALSPVLADIARLLTGWESNVPVQLGQDDVLWKPPGATEIGFHQDGAYISRQFVPESNNSITFWIALDDADERTGVVQYAVGSHKWNALNDPDNTGSHVDDSSFHGASDYQAPLWKAAKRCGVSASDVSVKSVVVPAGSVVAHHQDVWHGSGCNVTSDTPRRALGVHVLRGGLKWCAKPMYIYARYKHPKDSGGPDPTFSPSLAGSSRERVLFLHVS